MRIWTAHSRPQTSPILVREGFSWGALVFGPIWLLAHRAWIAGALALLAGLAFGLLPNPWSALLGAALAISLGLFGGDLWRWSLERRGFLLTEIIAAPDEDSALARLLERRPDLARSAFAEILR